ncbi:MAG TPA: hypothetical protein VI423_11340 [Paenisporosarcina sp.]|nr:hypothetical protein [Paenisporosarcina sp.]
MFNKSAANEIAQTMTESLNEPAQENKLSKALEHLNTAAELFESVGNIKCAALVTDILADTTEELITKSSAKTYEEAKARLDAAKKAVAEGEAKNLSERAMNKKWKAVFDAEDEFRAVVGGSKNVPWG